MYDVIIAGAGVIGGMVARQLSRYRISVCLLEKEHDVACGASKANSGIIHGGYDPKPGTLKAKLNTVGVEKLFDTAKMLNVPCRRNGSMVCAFSEEENETVRALYERGIQNGIPGLSVISGDEARAIEPALSPAVTSALLVTNAGIICPYQLTIAAVGNAMDNGVALKTDFAICAIDKTDGAFAVTAESGECVQGRYFVNCAGGYADKIAAMAGDAFYQIIPRSGEYMLLDKAEGQTVSHTIFQCPTKDGKGILVTPTADGNLLTGPTATAVGAPDDTDTTQGGLDAVAALAKKSVPSVNFRQVITSFCGVRASEKNEDFIIEASKKVDGFIHVAAIDSPGLTCSAAIAEYVVDILKEIGLSLPEKIDWDGTRENTHAFRDMSDNEKNAYIAEHPDYGKIVCRCETISEGEIRDACRRNPKARDIDGVKRRTRAGMGRCQGGFCSPFVMKLIAEEAGIPMEDVTKKGSGSNPIIGKL